MPDCSPRKADPLSLRHKSQGPDRCTTMCQALFKIWAVSVLSAAYMVPSIQGKLVSLANPRVKCRSPDGSKLCSGQVEMHVIFATFMRP